MNAINRFIDSGEMKALFEHVRNLLVCAMLFASGSYATGDSSRVFLGTIVGTTAGVLIIIVAGILTVMNMWDGVRRLSKLKRPLLLRMVLFVVYLSLALRIVEITWPFRTSQV